jgi:S1-C subfamily serine protease
MDDSLDWDIEEETGPKRPDACSLDLKKYFYLIAAVAAVILAGTYWYTGYTAPKAGTADNFAGSGLSGNAPPLANARSTTPVGTAGKQVATRVAGGPPMPFMRNVGSGGFASVAMSLRNSVVNISTTNSANAAQAAAPNPEMSRFANPFSKRSNGSIGSGIIIRNDGYIISNYHIVRGAGGVVVTVFTNQGTQRYRATIVKMDEVMDLVLLKINPQVALQAAVLGDSNRVRTADEVIAIGSPFGLDQTVSRGIVSALRKSLNIEGITHANLIQTDAAINQGNSGGPLIASNATVIGINTAIYTPTGAFSGIGFAIPSNQVRLFMQDEMGQPLKSAQAFSAAAPRRPVATAAPAINTSSRPPGSHNDGRNAMNCTSCHQFKGRTATASVGVAAYQFTNPPNTLAMNVAAPSANFGVPGANISLMGAGIMPLNAALAERLKQPRDKGVFVSQIIPGSPSAMAGLQAGDIILKAEGKRIWAPGQLTDMVKSAGNGNNVRLSILRNGKRDSIDLTVALGPAAMVQAPASAIMRPRAIPNEFNWRGINVENFITVALPQNPGEPALRGAEIDGVRKATAAAKSGLQPRDIILQINSQPVGKAELLDQAIRDAKGQTSNLLMVMRNGRQFFVMLP